MAEEVHEHYDADGNFTGRTVVTRGSLWDDNSRARAMRLYEHNNAICRCGCGLPYAVSHDPDQPFIVDSEVCYAGRQLAKVREDETKKHENDPKWSVGRHHYVYAPSEKEVADRLQAAAEQAREEPAQ